VTYTPKIYDWRGLCSPIDQVFRAGGESTMGGMTLGGFSSENPQPGGRGELVMNFEVFATDEANLDASWTISRLLNGNVMRVPLYRTIQLVPLSSFHAEAFENGIPWSESQPWGNGENWAYSPTAPIAAAGLRGSPELKVDLGAYGQILKLGHVFGIYVDGYDFAHKVMDITYDSSDVATIEVSPPLRRDVGTTDGIRFFPTMLVTCANAREVMGNFSSGRHMQLSAARFVEALV